MQNTSPSKLNFSLKMTILSLFASSLLVGCGIRGDLKTPPPIFGGDSVTDSDRVPTEDLDKDDDDDNFDPLADPEVDE
jgi:predicted small lipoprotein YifL